MSKHNFWLGIWNYQIVDKAGNIKDEWSCRNALADEGENNLLDAFFLNANVPTTFYLRLFNDTPEETDSLSDLTGEPTTGNYSAQEVERSATGWPTLELDAGDWQIVSKQVTFLASGGTIGPVTYAVLATSSDNAGKLIAFNALQTTRNLLAGDSLKVTLTLKLQ